VISESPEELVQQFAQISLLDVRRVGEFWRGWGIDEVQTP
jgi:hypothetical protein